MAKADLQFTAPVPPYTAFNILGAAMTHCGVQPFAQEGWALKGQESMGLFKMGWPATVTATVGEDGHGGSTITLHGENFGYALNKIHLEGVLRKIGEAVMHAVSTMPPIPTMDAAMPPAVTPAPLPDDPNLPPRVG